MVVAVPRSKAKYCLPSRKYCSGCIRLRYCATATLASGSDVAKYQGSRCPRPQYSAQVHRHYPIGTIAYPRQKHIAIGTQGIVPQQSLIAVGSLDVDIAFESYHIVHCAASVAGHFL